LSESRMPKVISVFRPLDNQWVKVEETQTKIIFCPGESSEIFHCSCGYSVGLPFKILEHLREHGLDESVAIHVFVIRDYDHSQEYLEIGRGEPIPEDVKMWS